ncbi:MAG: CDP-glycerol glycerophosphotransferase family protein [Clostridiales bacterium]|nr:CDP-glycerol glycerophosphotransferase family protein [Clostridiales bacterium]
MGNIFFNIKQILKMLTQNFLLPVVYEFWRLIYRGKKADLIIFADAHHHSLPVSMECMHQALEDRGYSLTDVFCDYESLSAAGVFFQAAKFMRLYARASHVFICDNFLPVSSCRKREDTTVVQLWHSCGALKKTGYDARDDIPAHYVGNIYKNYNLVTVSAPYAVPALSGAMRQPEGVVCATGVSRTDIYYDPAFQKRCRGKFRQEHPEAEGKKVILWAPTFRGNAGRPREVGFQAVTALEEEMGEKYFFLKKLHPHMEKWFPFSNSKIPTEELLAVADLLITDYSSIVFDYCFQGRPFVLFAPDLEEYEADRGFYLDYETLGPHLARNDAELKTAVREALREENPDWIRSFREFHVSACDGHATERILRLLKL